MLPILSLASTRSYGERECCEPFQRMARSEIASQDAVALSSSQDMPRYFVDHSHADFLVVPRRCAA